jgi:hypothetical protein
MNTKQVLAAAALALVASASYAQADDVELQHFGANLPSQTTRAAVRNEAIQARARGETMLPEESVYGASRFASKAPASGVTRAEVRAAVLQARADGSLDRLRVSEYLGDSNSVASTRTREEVRAEALAATRAGQAARVQAGH